MVTKRKPTGRVWPWYGSDAFDQDLQEWVNIPEPDEEAVAAHNLNESLVKFGLTGYETVGEVRLILETCTDKEKRAFLRKALGEV